MSKEKENILSVIAFCAAHSGSNKMMEAACKKFGISLQSKAFQDVLELRATYERELNSKNHSIDKRALLEKIQADAEGIK